MVRNGVGVALLVWPPLSQVYGTSVTGTVAMLVCAPRQASPRSALWAAEAGTPKNFSFELITSGESAVSLIVK